MGQTARGVLCSASLIAVSLPVSAYGTSITDAAQLPIQGAATSKRSIYDLERCIIDIDAGKAPSIYRQPDRPNETIIAYNDGKLIYALIQLEGLPSGATVRVRSVIGPSGHMIERSALGCAA